MRKVLLGIALLSLGSVGSAAAADSADNAYMLAAAAFAAGHSQEAYEILRPYYSSNKGSFKFDLLYGESACHTASADMWGASASLA